MRGDPKDRGRALGRRRRHRSFRSHRPGLWASAVLVPTLLLFGTLLPPVASSPTALAVFSAPYVGATTGSWTKHYQGGCSHVSLADARWNATSGYGGFSTRATLLSCAPVNGTIPGSSFFEQAMTTLKFPIPLPAKPGIVTVVTNVTFNGTSGNRTAVQWNCPATPWNPNASGLYFNECLAIGRVDLNSSISIVDTSTHSVVAQLFGAESLEQRSTTYSVDNCYPYGCYWSNYSFAFTTGNLSHASSTTLKFTPMAAHSYAVVVNVGLMLTMTLVGFAKSNLVEAVNLGTQGHSWSLDSVSVS